MSAGRWSGRLGHLAAFAGAAAAAYLIGVALLAAWSGWAAAWPMMGVGPGWALVLVAAGLVVIAVGVVGLGGRRAAADAAARADDCPRCGAPVEASYVLCPECHAALRTACPGCQRMIKAGWSRCPYCGMEIAAAAPAVDGARPAGAGVVDDGRS